MTSLRRLRDFQDPTGDAVGQNLTRQLKALEGNAGDAVAGLHSDTLKRFPFVAKEERRNGRMVAPGQAIGVTNDVARIALAAPRAKDAGKLTAIYRSADAGGLLVVEGAGLGFGDGSVALMGSGVRLFLNDGENYQLVQGRDVYDVTEFGAVPGRNSRHATRNTRAIQRALDAADRNGGGVIYFPGGPDVRYAINGQLTTAGTNIKIWAPGGAKLFLAAAFTSPSVVFAVGDLDAGIETAEGDLLNADVAAGDMTMTLVAGKGANFSAGQSALLWSDSIIPGHHSAVIVRRCEFINIYSVTGDDLVLSRPLRYDYATADDAQIYPIDWVEGFEWDGLGIDGNDQIAMSTALLISWAIEPKVSNAEFRDIQQRGVRMQGCWRGEIRGYSQSNGRSAGFQGATGLFSYATCEGGPCEGLVATGLKIDRCRHGYTTIGMISNVGTSSPLNNPGFGVPTYSKITGVHTNARGACWDTHETGLGISFIDCVALGGLTVGAQNRCVDTKFINYRVRDCVGAAIQMGSDSIGCVLESFDFANTNTGTDEATSVDWTKESPIQDRGEGTSTGEPRQNELDNSSFELWDRGDSFSATGGTANRWKLTLGTGESVTAERRPLAETRPDAGKYYLRLDRTVAGSTPSRLSQYIEDVRSYAGKRLTLSFEMRDSIGGSDVHFYVRQHFGTGTNSPSADVDTAAQARFIDGAWRKYNATIDVPDLTGKTIGDAEDSTFQLIIEMPVAAGVIQFDIDNVKLEVSPIVTDYVMRPIAAETEACRRYYETSYNFDQFPGSTSGGGNVFASAPASPGSHAQSWGRMVYFTVRKALMPTVTIYAPTSGTQDKIRNLTAGTDIDATISLGFQSFYARPTTSGDVAANDVTAFSWVAAVADFE